VLIAQTDTSGGSALGAFLPIILLGVVFYLAFVLPQRRRRRAMQNLRAALEVGDEVRTIGGIHGTITAIDESTVTLDVGAGTRITFLAAAVAENLTSSKADDAE